MPHTKARSPENVRAHEEDVVAHEDGQIAKGARITGDSRGQLSASLKDLYEAGASIRSLALQTGRSYGFVHQVLAESGARLRSRGGPNRTRIANAGVTTPVS
ncbi:MAG: helix-turn-helix domain-containing protein [Rhodococcus sp. (in: high G+C Gram-positive bacteria)]